MKAKKLKKVILSFVLSAALLVEPAAGISIVHAEEESTSERSIEDPGSDDLTTDEGDNDQGEPEDSEESVDPGQEEGNEKEDSSEKEDEDGKDDGAEEGNTGKEDGSEGEENNDSEEKTEDPIEEDEVTDEEIPDEDAEEAEDTKETEGSDKEEKEEDLDGFSEMPSAYKLNSFQKELKAELASSLSQIDENEEGVTYAERQVYTFADSQETAEKIAEAYHAEIISFDMGVLTLRLSADRTVKEALTVSADARNNLPAVWPDYRRELYGEIEPEAEQGLASEMEIIEEEYTVDDMDMPIEPDEDEVPSLETYEQVLNELDGSADPFLSPSSDSYQWFHTTIGSPYVWDAGYLGQGIRVGVVDSGIDSNADLSANVVDNRDFCDGTSNAGDVEGHGTHVAGIIAALMNGNNGVGVAPQAKIYNARVFGNDANKSGYDSTIIAAINYLIGEEGNANSAEISSEPAKVDIINMSLGGPGKYSPFQFVLDKAYKKGVIVFAATGNDGGSLMHYPASYDHVIAVAATDTNNQRAYFSNYGAATDLAAPGVNIYSTLGSGYGSLQGTSMACPVAAGEAAVILSGANVLPTLQGKAGEARVAAVESIMKGNVISAGSGMGKGITSLTKVFKLSTAATKPNAPIITSRLADDKQTVEITIQVQAGMSLCYTTNGKNPVYKNEIADANTTYVDSTELQKNQNRVVLTLDCSQTAKGSVKAFAINASGVIGPVKSLSYTLAPYVGTITVTGPARVEAGKAIQLTAAVTPTYATNKAVTWEIKKSSGEPVDPAKIKIDAKKGRITTTAGADLGTYIVTVTAQDQKHTSTTFSVEVIGAGTTLQSIAFDRNLKKELWITKTDSNPEYSLISGLIAKEKQGTTLVQIDSGALAGRIIWTSSKPAVAEVDSDGKVTAKSIGTTTITAKANDNGNKKATINITVKQAVTDIKITTDKGKTDAELFSVAAGKSMTLKASVMPVKPTNSKVKWSIDSDNPYVTINQSNGKITVRANASAAGTYKVTAIAADNQGASATQDIKVYSGAIGEIKLNETKTTLYTKQISDAQTNTRTLRATIKGVKGANDFNPNAYMVTSSNEAVVRVERVAAVEDGVVDITITTTGNMYGKSNVVIAATDGSNKKATCAVTVSGGITKAELQDSSRKRISKITLFRNGTTACAPKTTVLYAAITGSQGANTTAYEVTSSNPKLVSVSVNKNSGEITLETGAKSTGKATITLMATDGSKKKATCTVTVCNPPSRINVAPKAGEFGCVVPGKSVQFTATLETENGVVSNKNVTWKLEDDLVDMGIGITVNSSGKISVPKKYKGIDINESLKQSFGKPVYGTVYAIAKDGSGVQGQAKFYLAPMTTDIRIISNVYLDTSGAYCIEFWSNCTLDVTCSSSAPKVASPTLAYYSPYSWQTGTGGYGKIRFVPNQRGAVSFTIKTLDGSGKQVKTPTIRFK